MFILIALYTGARRSAILGLRWSQIDLIRGRIDFNEPGRPRTNKRRPIIPIPRALLWFLKRRQATASCPYVIAHNGQPIQGMYRYPNKKPVQVLYYHWHKARIRAGFGSDVIPHVLRHSAGTWMAQAGVDMWQIGGWLGHSQQKTTELYAHHSPDHFAEAKAAMERRR
jgi:integrase